MNDVKHRYLRVIKSIDFSKGFSAWYAERAIPWRRTDNGTCQGEMIFSTTGLDNVGHIVRHSWKMRYEICAVPLGTSPAIAGLADGVKFELESETSEVSPVIYRMVITGPDGRELLELCDMQIFSGNGSEMRKMSKHVHFAECCTLAPVDKFASFQLWIYVPKLWILRTYFMQAADGSVGRGSGAENLLRSVMAEQRNVDDDETDDLSDVDLVLIDADGNEYRRYPCHRAILASASLAFKRLLRNRPTPVAGSVKRAFNLPNINEVAMKRLLEFLYIGQLPKCTDDFDDDSLFQLINAADQYDLPVLKEECEFLCLLRLKSQHNDDPHHDPNHLRRFDPNGDPGSNRNSLKMLRMADLYKLDRLKAVCMCQLSTNMVLINKKREEGFISNALFAEMIAFCQMERGKRVIIQNAIE